jgi:hypothetical protein
MKEAAAIEWLLRIAIRKTENREWNKISLRKHRAEQRS